MSKAVSTEKRAVQLINDYLKANKIPFGRLTGGGSVAVCGCFKSVSVNYVHNGFTLIVEVCGVCGNDKNDYISVNTWS